jgi:hypothetical protein
VGFSTVHIGDIFHTYTSVSIEATYVDISCVGDVEVRLLGAKPALVANTSYGDWIVARNGNACAKVLAAIDKKEAMR